MTPFQAMSAAVAIVSTSPHPKNKIAATLFSESFAISKTNHWPHIIEDQLGRDQRIGSSSGTIHAETACIVSGHKTDGAALCITDPFCPNCAKNIAEAGIKTIYIDHKGFQKDFFARRSDQFENMSMQICERAGISVYELWRKDEKIVPIYMAPDDYTPPNDSPVFEEDIDALDEKLFQQKIAQSSDHHKRRKFTLAFVKDKDGKHKCLTARAHAVVGYSMQNPDDALKIERPNSKYSFIQEPVNRMIMHIARHGYSLESGFLYCSQVPTAREQVNLIGAGIRRITIGDISKSRDAHGIDAMQLLKAHNIIDYS